MPIGSMRFEQFRGLEFENLRKLLNRVERCGVNLSLECRNVSSVDAGQVGQGFLRQLLLRPNSAEVLSEDLPQRHANSVTLASTLHPRSIHYKSGFWGFDGRGILFRSPSAVAAASFNRAKRKAPVHTSFLALASLALCACGQGSTDETNLNYQDAAAAAAQPLSAPDTSNGSEPDYVNIEAAAVQPILDDCREQGLTDEQCYPRTQAAAFEADAKADGRGTVSAADLYGAFLANEAAAEDRYHGALLVTGVSGGVQRNSGLSGFLGGYTLTVIPGVQASISREDGASIPFGSKVMLACGSVGYSRGVVSLGSCSLKSAAPITLEDNAKDMSVLEARTGAQ